MNQLTALERELLSSVETLASGCREETKNLRTSFNTYAKENSLRNAKRLNDIEARQSALEGSLSKLTTLLEQLGGRLNGYENSLQALNTALTRLKK